MNTESRRIFVTSRVLTIFAWLCVGALSACSSRLNHNAVYRDVADAVRDGEDLHIDRSGDWDASSIPSVCIATYNVHRFFDTVCDSGSCEPDDYQSLPSDTQFERQAAEIGDAIDGLDCDIVLLQEIETQACLEAIQTRLEGDYPVAILGEIGSDASVDVAVLAPGEMIEVHTHRDRVLYRPDGSPTSFAREFLEVHITLDQARVIVFAAHFRSKSNDDPGRRLAEAQAAHDIVTQVARDHPDALVVLGGDLNDVPGSPPIDALEQSGLLYRVASELLPDEAATYEYYGQLQAIDHLFLALDAAGSYISGTATVVGGPDGYGGSDHGALRAEFRLPNPQ